MHVTDNTGQLEHGDFRPTITPSSAANLNSLYIDIMWYNMICYITGHADVYRDQADI